MGISKLEELNRHEHDISISKLSRNQGEFLFRFYKDLERVPIDTGSCFGNVITCIQRFSNQRVALKIFTIPQHHINNGIPSFILNHASILKDLNHPNIARLLQVVATDEDVYFVFEEVNLNLERYITNPMLSIDKLEKSLLRQALSGLAYLHSHNIVHTDIDPFSILFRYTLQDPPIVKLCGIRAPKTSPTQAHPCYRAPELLMGSTHYSSAVDIWSMGCMFAHIINRRPVFHAMEEHRVLAEIFCLLGTPTEETWPGVSSICNFIQAFNPPIQPKDLAEEFPSLEPAGLDLLSKMLCLCPNGRISAYEALDHPYLRR